MFGRPHCKVSTSSHYMSKHFVHADMPQQEMQVRRIATACQLSRTPQTIQAGCG